MAQRQINIPERTDDEPPASADQLARIRELTTGLSLQGYRFDYRKLGTFQADAILNQLNAMNDQQSPPRKPAKQGPGCIASLAKGTTALIVWAVILACVAGGASLIYWQISQTPDTASTDENPDQQASTDTPNSAPDGTRESAIFEGLGVSGSPDSTPDDTPKPPEPDTPDPTPDVAPPTPPPTPVVDRLAISQLNDLERMLVQLSQFTRDDFPANVRAQSSQAMHKKLEAYTQALSALDAIDPTLSSRIHTAIDAFAAPDLDGQALRDDINAIRAAFPDQK